MAIVTHMTVPCKRCGLSVRQPHLLVMDDARPGEHLSLRCPTGHSRLLEDAELGEVLSDGQSEQVRAVETIRNRRMTSQVPA